MRSLKLFLIILLIPLLALSIFFIHRIYKKHKSSTNTKGTNGDIQERSNDNTGNQRNKDSAEISNLNNDIKEYRNRVEAKPNVTIVDVSVEKCSKIVMKNKQKFYQNKNTVLVNAANTNFQTGGGGLNNAITDFVKNKNGVTNNKWTELGLPLKYNYDNRIKISKFANGYVLHLVGLQAGELKDLNLKIEDVEKYLINLYLNGLKEIESIIKQGNVLLCCVSTGIYAYDGVDSKGKSFSKKEFILRAKLACLKAVYKYNGNLNIVLNFR